MRRQTIVLTSLAALAAAAALSSAFAQSRAPSSVAQLGLKSAEDFQSIGDKAQRSRAMFTEMSKVFTSPRCMNCHPAGDQPHQGNDRHEHIPVVWRSDSASGEMGTTCSACHGDANFAVTGATTYQSIPGHPRWGVAPLVMAWEGKSVGDLCRQLKDKDRNGGRSLAALQEHIAKDDLVAWGWHPGPGRDPAPGSQEAMGKLTQAWIDTGAECPLSPPSIKPQ
jgi:cytochrome c553